MALAGAIAGAVAVTLFMANRDPFWLGPLIGAGLVLLTTTAWVAWLGPSTSQAAVSWRSTSLGKRDDELVSPLAAAGLGLAVFVLGVTIGGYEWLPVTILVSLSCLVPPALHRPGLAVLLVIAAMYLPLLGASGLWDPWETHYGEVAREVLARNDWISLWWAQDKWFWSKPVLLFWMEALSMGVLGVDFMPDANPAHPEWALRLPTILITFAALAAIYLTVRRIFGARAGALATLVTATLPQFFFISHQAITDLPLVAAITMACCCLILAVNEDPDREARPLSVGPWTISVQHVVLFVLIALVLPQALYLISRNISWIEGAGLVAHPDRFLYGSAGNVDVPGNPQPRDQSPYIGGLLGQPFVGGVIWLSLLSALLAMVRKDRSTRALWMYGFYVCCALAFMAKGLPGIAIPGAAALFYLIASRRWSLLGSGELRVAVGILVVSVVSLPWYAAMFVRHGHAFTNRLLIHDHINRLAAGVHGDQGTIEYFLSQIGYATFPWIGLMPVVALFVAGELGRAPRSARAQTVVLLTMWLLSAFVLFSAMVTKFHHYVLPVIVPAGILIGVALGTWWGPKRPMATFLAATAGACLVLGFGWLTGDPRGIIPTAGMQTEDWILQQARPLLGSACIGVGALLAGVARRDLVRSETTLAPQRWSAAVGVAVLLGACVVAFVGRDLGWATSARPQGDERLIQLFVYNYGRSWPAQFDYRATLTGFAVAASIATALASLRSWRPVAARALCGVAVVFCAWGLNVYMTDLAPHWSARDLTARYYADRQSPEEPLLAWQMNWKGENFYTGNRVYVFAETDNKRIKEWLADNEGRRVYVLLEHNRLTRFEKLLPDREIRTLSTKRDNNKFLLVTLEI